MKMGAILPSVLFCAITANMSQPALGCDDHKKSAEKSKSDGKTEIGTNINKAAGEIADVIADAADRAKTNLNPDAPTNGATAKKPTGDESQK